MKDKKKSGLSDFFAGIALGLFLGIMVGSFMGDFYWKTEAIKHKAAHYDSQTGKFTWNQ